MHVQLITATATAAATTGTAAAAVTGDSLTALNGKGRIDIVGMWGTNQTAGFAQISFPSGHDTTRGYRVGIAADTVPFALPLGVRVPVQPQEVISATIGATAVAGDVEQLSMLVRYENFQGIDQNLLTWEQVRSRADKFTSIEASLASSAGPGYSGTESIDSDSNLLQANRNYALLGFTSRTRVHCVGWVGPDTGNVRLGAPGILRSEVSAQWFKLQSLAHGEPMIPVINSGNRAQTNWFVHTDENAGTFVVTAHLVMLK